MIDIKSFVKTRTKMNTEPATSTAPDLSNAVLADVILSIVN